MNLVRFKVYNTDQRSFNIDYSNVYFYLQDMMIMNDSNSSCRFLYLIWENTQCPTILSLNSKR